jgi:hypothetical protein
MLYPRFHCCVDGSRRPFEPILFRTLVSPECADSVFMKKGASEYSITENRVLEIRGNALCPGAVKHGLLQSGNAFAAGSDRKCLIDVLDIVIGQHNFRGQSIVFNMRDF